MQKLNIAYFVSQNWHIRKNNGASQGNRQAVHEPEPVLTVPVGQKEDKPDGIEKEQVQKDGWGEDEGQDGDNQDCVGEIFQGFYWGVGNWGHGDSPVYYHYLFIICLYH